MRAELQHTSGKRLVSFSGVRLMPRLMVHSWCTMLLTSCVLKKMFMKVGATAMTYTPETSRYTTRNLWEGQEREAVRAQGRSRSCCMTAATYAAE